MTNDIVNKLSQKFNPRFGQISVEKGFVTSAQVKQALLEQIDDDLAQKTHRLLGRILLENGWVTAQQIEIVLNELFRKDREEIR